MSNPTGKFKIQTVAEMTGVPASTLRTWEQRYGFPSPDRTASAYRMYSQSDIDQIARVRELCDDGMGPAEAVQQVLESGPAGAAPVDAPVVPGDARGLAEALHEAIEAFDPLRTQALVRSALLLGSHAQAFEQWIWPAWRRVGERWLAGELGRHHERLAAELLGQATRDMLRLSQPLAPAPWAVLGCFVDEDDPGPALGAALALQGAGLRAQFLGPRTRAAVIREAARALGAEVVGLSVTEAVSARGARDLVDDYAAAIGQRRWFVTGPGVDSVAASVEGAGGRVARSTAEIRALLG
jgi:MerR family transcriptional regulator, light-induced transcriptional regulator